MWSPTLQQQCSLKKRDSNGEPICNKFCPSNYHYYEWFGLGRSDYCSRVRNDKTTKDRRNWNPLNKEELRDNSEYMKFLLDIKDGDDNNDEEKTTCISDVVVSPSSSTNPTTVNSKLTLSTTDTMHC